MKEWWLTHITWKNDDCYEDDDNDNEQKYL